MYHGKYKDNWKINRTQNIDKAKLWLSHQQYNPPPPHLESFESDLVYPVRFFEAPSSRSPSPDHTPSRQYCDAKRKSPHQQDNRDTFDLHPYSHYFPPVHQPLYYTPLPAYHPPSPYFYPWQPTDPNGQYQQYFPNHLPIQRQNTYPRQEQRSGFASAPAVMLPIPPPPLLPHPNPLQHYSLPGYAPQPWVGPLQSDGEDIMRSLSNWPSADVPANSILVHPFLNPLSTLSWNMHDRPIAHNPPEAMSVPIFLMAGARHHLTKENLHKPATAPGCRHMVIHMGLNIRPHIRALLISEEEDITVGQVMDKLWDYLRQTIPLGDELFIGWRDKASRGSQQRRSTHPSRLCREPPAMLIDLFVDDGAFFWGLETLTYTQNTLAFKLNFGFDKV
ncbi:hypothetical protein BU17DRAFT_67141 [Hysterangium stoloniferum]|nr:hypothetical protein BU17DRAFT_67141 [Hysterangium stoloniferum]